MDKLILYIENMTESKVVLFLSQIETIMGLLNATASGVYGVNENPETKETESEIKILDSKPDFPAE
jgi:hypothetical protein